MKILVTGHKGFIGSHMLNALKEKHNVYRCELNSPFPSLQGMDWVIHLGALTSTTEKDVSKVMVQNFDFSVKLYNECVKHKVNIQYASSASVYGKNKSFSEYDPVDPKTPYAWSKYMFERYVKLNSSSIVAQGFRYFNVYGEGEDHKGDQASPFSKFKRQAELFGEVRVFEGSENFHRDFIPVEEVVNTHIKFLSSNESGVWNLGTGKTKSFMDVAKSFGVPVKIIPMPENLKDSYQDYTCADVTKLNSTLTKIDALFA